MHVFKIRLLKNNINKIIIIT